jgi:hypothetical protein
MLIAVALLGGCRDLVEDVPTDVCASGKRWVGEDTGDEEMHPGKDCVACHKDNDGPPFFAAGTIYGLYDEDGARTTQNECFGVEGATVTINAGDGQVFETRTNRAGNFFFEGLESDLVKPFSVVVQYVFPDGRVSRQPMSTNPSYGGCAHCHHPSAQTNTEACPGTSLSADELIQVTPVYTGPTVPGSSEFPEPLECEP